MKTPLDYTPQYSLSIYYLKKIMSKSEFDKLIKKYIQAKKDNWKINIKGKK